MHPLFGRSFPVLGICAPLQGSGYIDVAYRQNMTLRIPLSATTLAPPRLFPPTKLTHAAVTELTTAAEDCAVLCRPSLTTTGSACPPSSHQVLSNQESLRLQYASSNAPWTGAVRAAGLVTHPPCDAGKRPYSFTLDDQHTTAKAWMPALEW